MAEQTLRVLAARLGRRVDPVHEEEPGKVIHELRTGELAALDATPLTRYYGTVDATPLFLCLLAEHASGAAGSTLFHELREAVEATLGWIDRYGDHDGDGLLDYRASSPDGLRNQGWRDSEDGVLDEHGKPLEPPIALIEPQAYAARAKRDIARLFAHAGEQDRAGRSPPRPPRSSARSSASGSRTGASTRSPSTATGARAPRSPPTRATRCGRRPSAPSAPGRAQRADGRRPVLGLGDPDARPPRDRLQPRRLPPRHGLAARQRAVRRRDCATTATTRTS